MIGKLRSTFDGLEQRRQRLLEEIRSLSEEQRAHRPGPGAWSMLEVAHHLLLTEQVSLDAMSGRRAGGKRRRRLKQRIGYAAVWAVLLLGFKVKTPVKIINPDPEIGFGQIERDWDETRVKMAALLEGVEEGDLRRPAFKHPIAGPLDLSEALLFLVRHFDHHLRQVARIRKSRAFPAG